MHAITLRSERLVLDQPLQSDVDAITEYCQDPLFEQYLTVPWPYERDHAVGFVNDFVPNGWASGREATWALRLASGSPLLGVISFRFERNDLGFWLGGPHRGSGYMPEAVAAVADWAFDTSGAEPALIEWECVAGNLASARVAQKSGFRFAGSGPAHVEGRNGEHPLSWHATLAPGIRSVHGGWPAEVTA